MTLMLFFGSCVMGVKRSNSMPNCYGEKGKGSVNGKDIMVYAFNSYLKKINEQEQKKVMKQKIGDNGDSSTKKDENSVLTLGDEQDQARWEAECKELRDSLAPSLCKFIAYPIIVVLIHYCFF